jgi:4-diphosphocytidyl-2-C-methyl-D-erythritol kinase
MCGARHPVPFFIQCAHAMLVFPNAKINLGLNITSKLSNGYHTLQSCFYPLPWQDVLEIVPASDIQVTLTGIPIPGDPYNNLVVKAYQLLKAAFDIPPVAIHLHKIVPIGAGLGGGSADGAFALKALNELFDLQLSEALLQQYAGKLGSDCPFFIANKPIYATGTGTQFTDITLQIPRSYAVVLYPGIHISTKEAYAGVVPGMPSTDTREALEGDFRQWKTVLTNDFEKCLFPAYPQLPQLKAYLYGLGAWYASMSGSGSAVFGLFEKEVELDSLPGWVASHWCGYL